MTYLARQEKFSLNFLWCGTCTSRENDQFSFSRAAEASKNDEKSVFLRFSEVKILGWMDTLVFFFAYLYRSRK